ncbi:MAG TPA: exodeoxyribonuclease VII small subunit [Oligoflexia bacterium]|nr:exodeoxyribonuclease VII small subunit [Oligoflexia bacterium]HMR24893.1 exodeoxyribonuclease VII small subunit [Oligoflexia bacterium]
MVEKKSKKMAFEVALEELETIVSQLESKDMPLEKSLALFEKGISLSKTCTQQISEAEDKVDQLLQQLQQNQEQDD